LTRGETGCSGWAMRKRAAPPLVALIAVIVALPAILPVLAYASPPDPSWVSGIYDDGDFDNVVVLITSGTGHFAPPIPADGRPFRVLIERLPHHTEAVISTLGLFDSHPRAPPNT
jgi:hypothetical protein